MILNAMLGYWHIVGIAGYNVTQIGLLKSVVVYVIFGS